VSGKLSQLAAFPYVQLIEDSEVEVVSAREHKQWQQQTAAAPTQRAATAPAPASTAVGMCCVQACRSDE
jgi:hypothetical protein